MIHLALLVLTVGLVNPSPSHQSPFACNRVALNAAERNRHFNELGPVLRSLKTGVRELPDGYEFQFPGDAKTVAMLVEWAAQERRCCPFFDIQILLGAEGGPARLRLTGRPGTKEFIRIDGAAWIK